MTCAARIALVATEFPVRSETFVVEQVRALLSRGAEVVVFCDRLGDHGMIGLIEPDHERLRIVPWPNRRRDIIRACCRGMFRTPGLSMRAIVDHMRRPLDAGPGRLVTLGIAGVIAADGPFDACLAHFGPNGDLLAHLKERFGLPSRIATVFHGYDLSRYLGQSSSHAYAALRRSGDHFLPVSDFWAARLISLGFLPSKISVQHMGIDFRRFNGQRADRIEGPIRILSVGRFVEKKGFEFGVRAVSALIQEGFEIEYLIAGDGPLKNQVMQVASELGASGHIRFLGWKHPDEIAELQRESDLMLAPSLTAPDGDMEGIPVALMEAMASGTIVVSTSHSGIPELVEHGITGWLAEEGSVTSLVDVLRRALECRSGWNEVRAAARDKIEQEFNWEQLADALLELLCGARAQPLVEQDSTDHHQSDRGR